MKELDKLKNLLPQDLEQRKNWYSNVAEAYNKVRPRYPKELINRAVEVAQIPAEAAILELGCGPGIATVPFAQLGFSILCLEPSKEACNLAKQNCAAYPKVEIQQTTFEEWKLETGRFNAVLAATSFHWINPDIGCAKAADALQANGSLILLWNMTPQPHYEVYENLHEVYKIHAPSLAPYEDIKKQAEIAKSLGQKAIDSERFKDLAFEQIACQLTYSADNYLLLLSTLTPYLKIDALIRDALFADLREKIEQNYGGSLQINYLSAFQVAKKV
ncbi:2-polyprenyl-3-methyl-5-hydroxy-6-metoxy-1,4-benzoquinol methylase [Cylindrospermum stagnale PCC 7417]|uniref:2-polyprenyl-3-methyl-5-hydroxy-6-metoxy-1, 4-benzoquinol methylase n=1 Tax=Cylindrospermum stagnale PCC 7417 TaxID=56107 RepID=K9X4L8_9NOST|nr:class I SAM-dependent methyltransferase [Cylindrospermum stagnale]AFZ26582.1 2-polyprenyl-3-methyl-5-hydroxy-6-metoxy-1,4-benzoquinol methylase [Cylindrospermum stagnale PCC 7417]